MLFGNIKIPKISLDLPILATSTVGSLKVSVAFQYGVGINQVGNSVILGRNLQDGTLFSDIDELSVGDYIIITDINDDVVNYKVSDVYETSDSDTEFMERDTGGKRGITLSTSNDNGDMRLIVTAEETDDVVEDTNSGNDNSSNNNNNTSSTNSNTSTGGTQNIITNSNSNSSSASQNTYQNISRVNNSGTSNKNVVQTNLPKTGKSEVIVLCIFVAIISIIVSVIALRRYKEVK